MERPLTRPSVKAGDLLDHAAEFVAIVARQAPERYAVLRERAPFRELLAGDNAFNAGKLYVWAEYEVFREEFARRFPDAGGEACNNAFCRLFLKNDISVSRLVEFMERQSAAGALERDR